MNDVQQYSGFLESENSDLTVIGLSDAESEIFFQHSDIQPHTNWSVKGVNSEIHPSS